jgi:hypothetical protein
MPTTRINDGSPVRTRSEQARLNASKSRGPISAAGKARSSKNALTHGLSARNSLNTILQCEDPAQFQHVREEFLDEFRPASLAERRLVDELATIRWRLDRLAMIEARILNRQNAKGLISITTESSGLAELVAAWVDNVGVSNGLRLLRRYTNTLQRQWDATRSSFRYMELNRDLQFEASEQFGRGREPEKCDFAV